MAIDSQVGVLVFLHSNAGIHELPAELGKLTNLWQLDLEELNINNLPVEIRNEGESACSR